MLTDILTLMRGVALDKRIVTLFIIILSGSHKKKPTNKILSVGFIVYY